MKRSWIWVIFSIFFLILMLSPSYAQGPREIKPAQPDVKAKPIGPPPLPDLIISGGLRLRTAPFILGEQIKVPVQLRIENRGNAAAGPFKIAFFQLINSPPGAIGEIGFDGTKLFSGLAPTRTRPEEGIGFENIMGNVILPKSLAGQKVKIRGVVDSDNQVRESDEADNETPWLEVQLPSIAGSPGKK